MSIIIYTKDIPQRDKNENKRKIDIYCKNNRKTRYIDDLIYRDIGHRICLLINNYKFWVKSEFGYKSIEILPKNSLTKKHNVETYQLIDMNDKAIIYYYDIKNDIWEAKNFKRSTSTQLSKYRKAITMLNYLIDSYKIHYLNEYLITDITNYIKIMYIKSLDIKLLK